MAKQARGRKRRQAPKTGPGSRAVRTYGTHQKGRKPLYNVAFNDLVRHMVSVENSSDAEIAIMLGVHPSTIYEWKRMFPAFRNAFTRGEQDQRNMTENSLLKRANGMLVPAVKVMQHQGKAIVKEYLDYLPPDPGALKTWLAGNMREKYGDKLELGGAAPVSFVIKGFNDPDAGSEAAKDDVKPTPGPGT